MSVKNGKRVEVDLPGFKGPAGLAVVRGITSIAFYPTTTLPAKGEEARIDGARCRVINARQSDYIEGMWVAEIEKVGR